MSGKFLTKIVGIGLCLALVLTIGMGLAKQKDQYYVGLLTHRVVNVWEGLFHKAFKLYAEENGIRYNALEARNDPGVQLNQMYRLVDAGVDGIIVSAVDTHGLKPGIDYAEEHGVPVISVNIDVADPRVKMFIGWDFYPACRRLAQATIDHFKTEVEPIGQVGEHTALNIIGTPGTTQSDDCREAVEDVFGQYPIKIITIVADWDRGKAKRKSINALRANPDIDIIFGGNGPMGMGGLDAIKALGYDPKDYWLTTLDAMPSVLQAMRKGNFDMAFDGTPPQFETPLALHYMIKYLEEGEKGLPEVGDTVTTEDVKITGTLPKKYWGVDIWANNDQWAPAKVKTKNGHLWLMTGGVLVTKKNADNPALWGNMQLPGW